MLVVAGATALAPAVPAAAGPLDPRPNPAGESAAGTGKTTAKSSAGNAAKSTTGSGAKSTTGSGAKSTTGSGAKKAARDARKAAAQSTAQSTAQGAAQGTAAADAKQVTVLSYNVCGGSCPNRLTLQEWTNRMVRHLTTSDADVLLLQELCRGQYDSLRRALDGRYEGRWAGTVGNNKGCGKQWGAGADSASTRRGFGIATFVKGAAPIRQHRVWWLPTQGKEEPRALLCLDATLHDRTARICNTHLDWHADTQQVQAEFVAKLVTPWTAHIPVVLGGDLNAEPGEPSMGLFYDHSGGHGVFQEVDETDKNYFGDSCPKTAHRCRTGEGTDGDKKLDYILLSRRHFRGVTGDAIKEPDVSDHALVRGTGSWRRPVPRADFSWGP